jgi:hypothetical protein
MSMGGVYNRYFWKSHEFAREARRRAPVRIDPDGWYWLSSQLNDIDAWICRIVRGNDEG